MSKQVTEDEIRKLAELSRLDWADKDIREVAGSILELIRYMERLNELQLDDVEPMVTSLEGTPAMRLDEPSPGLTTSQALQNAPHVNKGHFSVPKTVG